MAPQRMKGIQVAAWIAVMMATSRSEAVGLSAKEVTVIAAIFNDDHIAESALRTHQRAAQMTPTDRFNFLAAWVLPNEDHTSIRLQVDFTPARPAMVTSDAPAETQLGGQFVCPAIDLIDVALATGRLDDLQSRLDDIIPRDLLTEKNQIALRAAILLRQQDFEAAATEIESFLPFVIATQPADSKHRSAEAMLMFLGKNALAIREGFVDHFHQIAHKERVANIWTAWNRQFKTLSVQDAPQHNVASDATGSILWRSANSFTAESRGAGIPDSRWTFAPGSVSNTVSHGNDRLYFSVPMTGEFQVECDFTSFGWTDTELLVCGTWVSPVYTHRAFDVGDIRGAWKRHPLSPRLTRIRDKLHYRTKVKDDVATTYVNGRKLHSQALSADHDPWVAIQNDHKNEGSAYNVRVTGTPVIPKMIWMSAPDMLVGWNAYDGEDVGWSHSHWEQLYRIKNRGGNVSDEVRRGGGIFAGRIDRGEYEPAAGSGQNVDAAGEDSRSAEQIHQEEAVFYHRPMLEDGTIEYEFYYSEDQFSVHPAIDRLCFLMQPAGVKVHWLTDGPYDRTDLSPDNAIIESVNQRGSDRLPLVEDSWNHVSFQLQGDVITLRLNHHEVYRRTLNGNNQRRFGFFHYADQSEVRIRNVVWIGDWPKALPSISEQSLAVMDTEVIDRNADHLKAEFSHNFANGGLPEATFEILYGRPNMDLIVSEEGVQATRSGASGYQNATFAPNVALHGDFDVVATYDDFKSATAKGGSASIVLTANTGSSDHVMVMRRQMHGQNGDPEQLVQCCIVQHELTDERRDYFVTHPVEERSGRLRLARRGSRVYFLTAEGSSPNFRLWGSREFSADPIRTNGLTLLSQVHQQGLVSVVWKDITIRAEKISTSDSDTIDTRVAELNEQRDKLPLSQVYDFEKQAPNNQAIYTWGNVLPWNAADGGLKIVALGAETWESTGLSTLQPINGDFDIRVEFDQPDLAPPKPGGYSEIFLQVEIDDGGPTQLNGIFSLSDTNSTKLAAQLRTTDPAGDFNYRTLAKFGAKDVTALRVARRGKLLTVLGRPGTSQHDRAISQVKLSDLPISGIKVLLHTGGADRTSRIRLKNIQITAEHYQPAEAIEGQPRARQKRILESLLDAFN